MTEQETAAKQIRIALVLYGGVSLAVYENGVTRCFHDLVRGRGVFRVLLDLLGATAAVDVIAGASAGGINGLMLAAALESGQEFAPLADLWRRLGDIGKLFRKQSEADEADSLLDGKYFHEELVRCFQDVCTRADGEVEDPGEIDVFVAGTDVDGHLRRYRDSLKRDIEDKEHRVVFHLQHRPGRKSLGVPRAKEDVNPDLQARILGAIGRITASFPVAFPAVKGSWLDRDVYDALGAVSSIDQVEKRSFVDGGVLDNKPFGPALRAIFYRMPTGLVDRRLFYVEPDPVPFRNDPRENHTPVEIGLSALTSIPGHEGIADDLDQLLEHNERVRWLTFLKKTISEEWKKAAPGHFQPSPSYVATRIETIARSLVIDCEGAPTINDYPRDSRSIKILDALRSCLASRVGADPASSLDPYDVAFHLRRSFSLLYEYHAKLEDDPGDLKARQALFGLGRLIKTLKIILSCLSALRDQLFAAHVKRDQEKPFEELVCDLFMSFLSLNAPWWGPVRTCLEGLDPAGYGSGTFLDSASLSDLNDRLKAVTLDAIPLDLESRSVLEAIGSITETLVTACDGKSDRFVSFAFLDDRLYPLTFTSGLYELDRVQFVRISPQDAQTGLSKGKAREKVAGDELAHFSAFLRRDWRSNDIMQGRFDGICQIIQSLLDDESLQKSLPRHIGEGRVFAPEKTRKFFPRCSPARLVEVEKKWQALMGRFTRAENGREWDKGLKAAANEFREQLIIAGQEDALEQDLKMVLTDLHFQEIKFGRCRRGLRGATSMSNDQKIELDARRAAQQDMTDLGEGGEVVKTFQGLRLGSQEITGPQGQVPHAVVGEYASLAYLMIWGMLKKSLNHKAKTFLDAARVRFFLRTPVQFVYYLFMLMRREKPVALALIAVATGMILGIGFAGYYFMGVEAGSYHVKGYPLLLGTAAALFLLMTVVINFLSDRLRKAVVGVGASAIVVAVITLCIVFWPQWLKVFRPVADFILSVVPPAGK